MSFRYSSTSNKQFDQSVESLTQIIPQIVKEFGEQMEKLSPEDRPTEASVEFGLLLTANTSVSIVQGSGESTLKITLTWIDDTD